MSVHRTELIQLWELTLQIKYGERFGVVFQCGAVYLSTQILEESMVCKGKPGFIKKYFSSFLFLFFFFFYSFSVSFSPFIYPPSSSLPFSYIKSDPSYYSAVFLPIPDSWTPSTQVHFILFKGYIVFC